MNKAKVRIGSGEVLVSIADSLFKRSLGLSFKKAMKGSEGMLFLFPFGARPLFWNFGMRFPIDVVWIRDSRVVGLEESVPSFREGVRIFSPKDKSDAALELVAGSARRLGLRVCDKIDIIFQ